MANMSYCRFQNTSQDMRDCYDAMCDQEEELSSEEESAKKLMLKLCMDMLEIHFDYTDDKKFLEKFKEFCSDFAE